MIPEQSNPRQVKFNRVCQLTRLALLPALGALLLVLPGFRAEAAAAARFALRTPGAVTSMDISSDGRQLLTVSTGRAYIWDLPSGRFIRPIQVAPCALQNAGFSADGLHIFSRRRDCDRGSGARELPLYRIFSGVLETRLHRTSGRLTAIAYADFSTNGQNRPDFLATADNGNSSYTAVGGPEEGNPVDLPTESDGLAPLPQRILATAADDGWLRYYDVDSGGPVFARRLEQFQERTLRQALIPVAFSPDLSLLAVRNWQDYYLSIIDVSTGAILHRTEYYVANQNEHQVVQFAPDGGEYFDGARLRRSRSGEMVATIAMRECCAVEAARFSADGNQLVILRRFHPVPGKQSDARVEYEPQLQAPADTPEPAALQVQDLSSGAPVQSVIEIHSLQGETASDAGLRHLVLLSTAVSALAWYPDGSRLFYGDSNGMVGTVRLSQ